MARILEVGEGHRCRESRAYASEGLTGFNHKGEGLFLISGCKYTENPGTELFLFRCIRCRNWIVGEHQRRKIRSFEISIPRLLTSS